MLSRDEFFREWSVDEIYEMVIEGSDTDMIAAQPLPLTDLFHDGLSPWEKCAEMAAKHPDRAVFWGSVNPLEGKKALDLMTRQVEDHGAKAFKFYNVRYDYGQPFPWRMDDPRIAYPAFERAQELGVNLIGVHKGVPLGPQPIEHTRTFDMDGAAANFPDINFVIFHVGLPWLDEVLWQIVRYPNLYASIAATVNFISRQPRVFAETLGKMMWWCGEDKIIYGGESPIWHPQWALEEFWNFELPRDIVEERGYPQLTEQAKRKILGREPRAPARDRRRGEAGGAGGTLNRRAVQQLGDRHRGLGGHVAERERGLEVERHPVGVVRRVADGDVLPAVEEEVAAAQREDDRALEPRRPHDRPAEDALEVVEQRVAAELARLDHARPLLAAQREAVGTLEAVALEQIDGLGDGAGVAARLAPAARSGRAGTAARCHRSRRRTSRGTRRRSRPRRTGGRRGRGRRSRRPRRRGRRRAARRGKR